MEALSSSILVEESPQNKKKVIENKEKVLTTSIVL
jgi:hypothetical protein